MPGTANQREWLGWRDAGAIDAGPSPAAFGAVGGGWQGGHMRADIRAARTW